MKRPFSRAGDDEGRGEPGSDGDWRAQCEKLKRQLDEMTRRNNERNNYINSVFSSMEDGFFLTDTKDRIVMFNRSAEALLDIDASCLFGDENQSGNEGAALRDAVMGRILDACRAVRREGFPLSLEMKNDKGSDLQVGISTVMSKYGAKSLIGILAIVKDVTERKKIENIRKEFVANVSHEFRTPLTLISGFIEMLRMYGDLPPEDRNRSLEILEIETGRLKKLISELLLLSKMENKVSTGEEGSIDIEKVLRQVVTVLSPLAEKKHQTLRTGIEPGLPALRGDESWIFHAVHNLVENAIKYTPEYGTISLGAVGGGAELRITVTDNGTGIAPEDIDRIFERFYRVDRSRNSGTGGSGLGLAIARDIVSIFNGKIEVESELGAGSTFVIRIPLAGRAPAG